MNIPEMLRLHIAYLRGEPGVCANLRGADLRGADLYDANLRDADLRDADLRSADLRIAEVRTAMGVNPLVLAQTEIVPREGEVIGWKKCRSWVLVKLRIPPNAKRSNATGRKCRAEFAEVLEVVGGTVGVSIHDGTTEYAVGTTVRCDEWCEDRFNECAGGIHFFITREEAEDYS